MSPPMGRTRSQPRCLALAWPLRRSIGLPCVPGESPDGVPGAIARVEADTDHWLAAGVGEELFAVVSGSLIVSPLPLDAGANVVRFAEADRLLASGYLWEESRQQLAYKPLLTAERKGRGLVINFTQEPAFRAQLDGLGVLLMNALLRSPAKVRRGLGG